MKKTALYEQHIALNAKMVEFSNWMMPVHYGSILEEHLHVHQHAGIFDVSHMGRIDITGSDAESLLDFLSTNRIAGKKIGSATYTVWCNPQGYALDDLIIYKTDQNQFSLIVNAGNRERDLEHLLKHAANYKVKVEPYYEENGILAIQGPKAVEMVSEIFPCLKEMASMECILLENNLLLSKTGYTGLGGCEIAASNCIVVEIWKTLLQKNKNLRPIGLGARDTLRLEKGYALYGHEINESIMPTESVARSAVKLNKADFVGKQALIEKERERRYPVALLLQEAGVAREGAKIFYKEENVGFLTSGTYSPSLEKGIALGIAVQVFSAGEILDIEVRGRQLKAQVVELPFVK